MLRILQNKSVKTRNIELYRTYSTLPIHLLHNYQLLVFTHKYVHQRTKLYALFSTYLVENTLVHHYNTRQKENFQTNVVQHEMGKTAAKYKDSKLWNNVHTELKRDTITPILQI